MEPSYLLENLPRKMTHEKNEDKSHAHSRQVVFKNPPAFVAMLNSSQLKPRIRKKMIVLFSVVLPKFRVQLSVGTVSAAAHTDFEKG